MCGYVICVLLFKHSDYSMDYFEIDLRTQDCIFFYYLFIDFISCI
jgi:hypothetical protein